MIDLTDGYKAIQRSLDGRRRHIVFAPDGTQIGDASDAGLAFGLAERHRKKAREKVRKCLCCGVQFTSEGPHNRMCNPCRQRDMAA